MTVAADPQVRGHDGQAVVVTRSAAAGTAGGADAVAGLLEDALDDAAEGEDDDDDQRGDAGDEEAVLDRGRAALVHLGQAGVQHDAQVVEHGVWLLVRRVTEVILRTYPAPRASSGECDKTVQAA